jgi:N-acetylglucosamine-6-phosphate deacetylase
VPPQESSLGGRLVLEGAIHAGTVHVAEGRIAAVELDGRGADGPYICPGFVDLHVHGWGGHDAMGGRAALDGMARSLLRRGVTSFLPTAVTAPLDALVAFADTVRDWSTDAPEDGAAPLGFNLEGPFISEAKKGAQNAAFIQVPSNVERERLEPLVEGLRVTTIAPELDGALELIRWFTENGVVVSLGHSIATVREALAAYAGGARGTTHVFNAMSGIDQHAPGLAVAALTSDAACVELIADGFHVDPSLYPLIFRMKPGDRVLLVSDAINLAGMDEGRTTLGGLEVEVRDGQCRLVSNGALAGSVLALDMAVRHLAGAGIGLAQAVASASLWPLTLLGVTDRGRIAPGQRADLVELDDTFQVRRVMRAGRWVSAASSQAAS